MSPDSRSLAKHERCESPNFFRALSLPTSSGNLVPQARVSNVFDQVFKPRHRRYCFPESRFFPVRREKKAQRLDETLAALPPRGGVGSSCVNIDTLVNPPHPDLLLALSGLGDVV